MESGNGGASSKGVLIPVPDSSDVFLNSILAPLQSAYLYEESKQFFRYKSAVLVKNPALEEKYNALRAKRKEAGYSEDDLKESYGFLLFDDVTKANALGEAGVLAGNSTCTTLGDPSKGVYISMYSDCLDLNRWYHGKSGYIAIVRLTKGKVKKVLENYTQNFTAPTVGYDCHVSEQLPSVSAKTSSFLAFERTQYYMYELLDDGSSKTAQCPSAACPFAIVSFSYTDTKATPVAPEEKSEMTKLVCHYLPWRGQLQIGSQFYSVGMRCTTGALIPAQLPPVVKVDGAISMSDLRKLLPRAVFETCIASEAFLDGLYCSLCALIPAEGEETSSLAQLLCEIKEKDLSLAVPLNDGGFLILLHSSHFLTYDDTGSSATDVLQGMFVFPESRAVVRDTKSALKNSTLSSEIHRVLPLLSYAEGEVEKTPIDPSEDLCEVLVQHMQSYAALINPGLAFSPSREVSIFPDQYDVPDAHKDLYSSPEWSNRAWQSLKSYLSGQASFQLPVSKASEILAAREEERREDLDDDVYICVSSPEEAPASPVSKGLEDHLSDQKSLVHVETSADSGISSAEVQVDLPTVPQNVVPDNLQTGDVTKDNEKCHDLIVLKKPDDMEVENILTPLASHDLPAELIVSITSAGRSVTDKTQGVVSTVSTTRHSDFPFSGLLHTSENNSVSDETDKTVLDCSKDSNPLRTKQRKLRSRLSKGQEDSSKGGVATLSLQTPGEKDSLNSQSDEHSEESPDHTQLSNPSRTDWRKLRRKRKYGKLSAKNKKARFAAVGLAIAEKKESDLGQTTLESTILMHLESGPMKKKTERWDLKAVISECGRVLVPHGSVDIADQIKSLKNKLQPTKDEQCPEKMLLDVPVNAADTTEMEQVSSTAPETAVDETEAAQATDDGNHVQNVSVHHVDPEQGNLRQPDGESPSVPLSPESKVHSSKKDDTVTTPSPSEQEKRTDTLPQGRSPAKGEFLFSKLKSVILRGKRKANLTMTEDTTANTSPDSEPRLKKDKVDSNIEALNRNNGATQSTDVGVEIVSKVLSVDPLFAYALGLTPKDSPDKVQKTEDQDTQQRKDSTVMIELTSFDKEPKIMHRPPSIFPRGTRIKTLKKHQGIPAEYIRKKWWLHFQTPACFASEKLNNKDCTRDNSVRKTVKEKVNSACSSTDALNLLADLALSANNDQVLPQPNPALERKPETSLKKSDLIKGLSSSEQESVLHALLRQPAARSIQALESPSPSQLVGDSELVGLISKEHGYSLPPSSSLLLGLPGTPFQVCPVSGSTRLLHHPQTMNGDGVKTLQPSVGQEDRSGHNRTPQYLKKYMVHRQKFRDSRNFVNKDGSIQVTRQWKENYDFSLDSKFTGHPKEKAIVRALHGPWDFCIQDTSEEERLIVHMWIGLFYSRSTARFFHVDSTFAYPYSEDGNSLDISSGITSKPADPELKASSIAASPSVTDTSDPLISKVLDLSKKANSVLDEESVILDLSLRNTNAEAVTTDPQVHRKETCVSSEQKEAGESLTSLKLPAEPRTFQCYKKRIHSTKINSEVKDDRSTHESEKTSTPSQKSVCLEHTDVPSFRDDGTLTPPQKEMRSESVEPETVQTASGIGQVSHGCKKESKDMKDGTENPETTEMTPKDQLDSYKSVANKETDCSMEAGDVVNTDESKDEESCEMKEDPSHESNTDTSLKVVHTGDDSANKGSSIVCNGHCSDNEELLLKEKPKAVSPGRLESDNVDVDCEAKVSKDEDYFSKEHGLDAEKHCVSAVEADKNLSDQPLPVMSDGSDQVNADCIAESNHRAQLDEQTFTADGVKVACHESPSKLPCTNDIALTDEHAISEKVHHTPSEMQPTDNDSATEERSETAVPMSDEGTGSLGESCASLSVPQKKDSVETENQNPEMSDFSLDPCRDAHEDPESKSTEGEDKVENVTQKESFQHQSPSPQHEVLKQLEAEEDFIEEADDTNEELDKSCGGVYIPFIGIATCGEDTMQTHGSHPQDKVQKVVQGHEKIPFISDSTDPETVLPNKMCSTPKFTAEQFPCKLSILEANETNQPVILGSESDSRCPTPTMDENPFGYMPSCGPSFSTPAVSGYETCKNIAQTGLRRSSTPRNDDPLLKQNLCYTSTGKSDSNLHHDFHPDLEQRTLRVLQSIDKFLSKSNLTGKSSKIKTADITESFASIRNRDSKYIPTGQSLSHPSAGIKNKKRSNEKPAASDRWDLHTVSSDCLHALPFENALEEVHAKFQLERTNSSSYFEKPDEQESLAGQDFCRSDISPPIEHLDAMKPNIDTERHKATTQPNLNHEPRPYSQRPVMAVKPSKSEESQAGPSSKDVCVENSAKNKQTKTPAFKYAAAISKLLEKKRKAVSRGNSAGLNDDEHEARELSSKSTRQANVSHSKPNSDEVKFASHQYQGREFTAIPSSSTKSSPKLVDANQDFFIYSSAEKVDRTTKKNIAMHQIDISDASTSFMDPADNIRIDDSLTLGPQSSIVCTVFNSDRRKSSSFLEQLSQRCLQDDITQTSVEKECLIFSEKMKQLLKKRKGEAIDQQDTHDSLRVSCTSPLTVCFSNLEEQDDLLDLLDTSIVGQKIKVDMSDRENRTDTTKTLHPEELPQTTSNPMENAWVSDMTEECARLYEATMQDICAVEKISFKPKGFRMDYPKTEPSNHFDFCDQMKKEMDEAFRSSLNSVVKKSCKTKYRFYILVTSDDVFFEETKAQLEAEGHTAVQPSEFFLGEEGSSSLLIILRNEDIAEHICEVPHLLELKKSPAVQFAGIDEPDDVVNLTHQELFTRGGFIMFDRAALEHLSLCNMKKLSEILQELSSNGKWKWMLHYRDIRRLKENARLSAEAKEKKDFLHWGQDAGILEVLPYHECDLTSKDQPDYLTCLMRLQVQNVSSRFPVFITDTTTDSAFERNGILTITLNSFLTKSPSETFTV